MWFWRCYVISLFNDFLTEDEFLLYFNPYEIDEVIREMKYKISCLYNRNVSCASWGGSRDTAITYSSERIENLVPRIIGHKYNLERYIEKSDVKKRMFYEVLSNFKPDEQKSIDLYCAERKYLDEGIKRRLLTEVYELYKQYLDIESQINTERKKAYLSRKVSKYFDELHEDN